MRFFVETCHKTKTNNFKLCVIRLLFDVHNHSVTKLIFLQKCFKILFSQRWTCFQIKYKRLIRTPSLLVNNINPQLTLTCGLCYQLFYQKDKGRNQFGKYCITHMIVHWTNSHKRAVQICVSVKGLLNIKEGVGSSQRVGSIPALMKAITSYPTTLHSLTHLTP